MDQETQVALAKLDVQIQALQGDLAQHSNLSDGDIAALTQRVDHLHHGLLTQAEHELVHTLTPNADEAHKH